MSLASNFGLMADYNQWMNQRIYEAASRLGPSELNENRGAFFGSITATLNHILAGDTIWLKRMAAHPSRFEVLDYVRDLSMPESLDSILYAEFEELSIAREIMDAVIVEFSDELSDEILSSPLSYNNMKGDTFSKSLGHLLQHFFNHQTHHRGQVTTLLNQAGVDMGETDLLYRIPDMEKA